VRQARLLTEQEFLRRANEKFGKQIDLSMVIYRGMNEPVALACAIHGKFKTTPVSFLNSTHGCPKCGRLYAGYAAARIERIEAGLTKSRPTRIAVMKVEVFGIAAYKVGVTTRKLLDRYRDALREILFEATLDETDALKLEQSIHARHFRSRDTRVFLAGLRRGFRWPGDSELYDAVAIPTIIEELMRAVAAIEDSASTYWEKHPSLSPPILAVRSIRKVPGVYRGPKPVIRLDTLEVFNSATDAAKALGSSQGNVSMACRGARAHVKGVPLAYLADYQAGSVPSFKSRQGAHHPHARRVRCVETGREFPTVSLAAQELGLSSGKIVGVCKGRRTTAGGFHWEYVDPAS